MSRWLLIALAACGDNATATPQVHDGFLHDADGRALIMRGVNLSGTQKNAPYLDDKTAADYARLRTDWGFNSIRFVMTWAAVEPAPGVYDDGYLDRVAERLGWARDAGLAVVLDMHEDIYGEGFGFDGAPRWTCDETRYAAFVPQDPWFLSATDPNVIACVDGLYERDDLRTEFISAWQHVADRLHDQPAIVGFDVLNEPGWGSYPIRMFEKDRLSPLYADIVTAVRGVAPHWVAFLEPAASRNVGIATTLRASFPDVMYAPHSYDSMAESGAGFDPARRQLILDNVADLAYEANQLEAGLWIGEYGGVADAPGIVEYMTAQYDAAGAVGASTMYWAYDRGGYGLLDADGAEQPTLLRALVRPYPERIAGAPISYAFDPATSTFTTTYTPDRGVTAPTLIAVPARLFPTGFTVACGDCEFEISEGELAITSPPSSSPATIVIHP